MNINRSRNLYFISDTHFFHHNIIKYCNRPFQDVTEMNNKIVTNYNKVVQSGDIVYFLGDIGWETIEEMQKIIKSLNGIKILVLGNHDQKGFNTYYNLGFSAVLHEATIEIGKTKLHLSHFPRRTFFELIHIFGIYVKKMRGNKISWKYIWKRIQKEWKNYKNFNPYWRICGHVHNRWKVQNKNINVSVDAWGFKPVPYKKILEIINKKGEQNGK